MFLAGDRDTAKVARSSPATWDLPLANCARKQLGVEDAAGVGGAKGSGAARRMREMARFRRGDSFCGEESGFERGGAQSGDAGRALVSASWPRLGGLAGKL